MTQNAFLLWIALYALPSFATVDSPVVQGLAGATRAGVTREAVFANPASVASITSTFASYSYEIPKVPDFNAGGRAYNVGLYDGGNSAWKGAADFSRIAKARIFAGGQGYVDRSEIRLATAHELFGDMTGGIAGRFIRNYNDPNGGTFFEGDVGILMPIFADLRGGLTFENVLNREDEYPQTVGAGVAYNLGYGFDLVADYSRLMSGSQSGANGWALAGEAGLASDFTFRGGIFREAYRNLRGWSLGLSWTGPRLSFDYAMKTVGGGPKERSHILGATLAL